MNRYRSLHCGNWQRQENERNFHFKKGDLIEAMLAQDDKEKQEEANAQAKEEVKEKKRERISNSLTAGVLQTEF